VDALEGKKDYGDTGLSPRLLAKKKKKGKGGENRGNFFIQLSEMGRGQKEKS